MPLSEADANESGVIDPALHQSSPLAKYVDGALFYG